MHDARHTFAVRAIRAGAPFEFVAAQLGHGSTQMVISVYGRFKPSESEMTDWERIARVQDESMASESAVTG
jgi:integrase